VPVSPEEAGNVARRDYDDRMLVLLDLAIRLQIDVTGRDDYSELPVAQPRDEARHFPHADAVVERVALCLQGEINKDGCDPATKAQLADRVTTAIP
jgi:hypothetical protein